jgi:ribonuclease G
VSEEILINITPTESRVAMVENGVLQEVWLDRVSLYRHLGNVYKGTVSRVLPGMQAAFVDVGLERTAFLHASDIYRVNQEKVTEDDQVDPPPVPPINELVIQGSEVIVQVIKDPMGTKGARLTTNLSIPSRFLVLLPDCDTIGISQRIEDEEERQRLKDIIQTLRPAGERLGYIVRTNAERMDEFTLAADMRYLYKVWQTISDRIITAKAGECIYEDLSMPVKALRDLMHGDVEKVRVDSEQTHEQLLGFVRSFIPDWTDRIERYDSDRPIFDLYGVEDEINQALHRQTRLKSGGYLVFDQTEAMTTIDVNTGAFVGHRTLEETIYKTNLEAAQAIARQLRLRNLGGIIIIDFIDMTDEEHKRQVMRTLEKALEKDHARTSICELSSLGLVEMTRKRTSESLGHMLCETCPECAGRGSIKSAETVCLEVFREIMRSGQQFEANRLQVMASPVVVDHILDELSTTVAELEELIGRSIRFQSEEQYTQEQFDVVLL